MEYDDTPDTERSIGELERGKDLGRGEMAPTPFILRPKGRLDLRILQGQFFQEAQSGEWRSIFSLGERSSMARMCIIQLKSVGSPSI